MQFALFNPDGTKAIGPVNIPNSDFAGLDGFEIATNGDEFLLGWTSFDRINATRISAAGTILGTQNVQSTGNWIIHSTRVAFNGESYLLAWTKYEDGGPKTFARRVSSAGVPLASTFLLSELDSVPIEILVDGADWNI